MSDDELRFDPIMTDDGTAVFYGAYELFVVDGIVYRFNDKGVCPRPMIEILPDHECAAENCAYGSLLD